MSDLTLKMLLLGQDVSLSRTVKGAGDEVERTGKKAHAVGKAVAVGLAGVGVGIGALLKTGWDETKDASAATAQLQAGIKSTGGAAGVTVDQLNDLAGSIQGYSGQTDDSIAASEKLLLTFTNIRDVGPDKIFDDATRATADMAAKMGGDASSYAVQLGKALNDPIKGITALTKIGVSFTAQQKEQVTAMVKAGDTAGAQKLILAELNHEFGGAAKAAGESVPGQMVRAQRSFEDVSQEVVTDLMPIIQQLLNLLLHDVLPTIKSLSEFWMQHKTILSIVAGVILGVVAVVKTISVVTKAWTAAQAALNVVLSLNPIGLIVIAILALIAVFILAYTHSARFRAIVTGAFGAVRAAAGAVVGWIRTNWPLLLAILVGPIGLAVLYIVRHWTQIKQGATDVRNWVAARFNDLIGFFAGLPGRIGRIAHNLFDGFKSAFRAAINWIIGAWNRLSFSVRVPSFHIKGTPYDVGGGSFGFGVPQIPLLARGGTITSGGAVVVGDDGPELLNLPAGATVTPLNRGRGGDVYTIYVTQPLGTPEQIVRAVLPALQAAKGRGVQVNLG